MLKRFQLIILIFSFIFLILGFSLYFYRNNPRFSQSINTALQNLFPRLHQLHLPLLASFDSNFDSASSLAQNQPSSGEEHIPLLQVPDVPILWTATLSGQLRPLNSPSLAASSAAATAQTHSTLAVSPFTKSANDLARQLTAPAALAIDLDSQVPLFSYNSHDMHYPASSLKMMTALVARQIYPPDQIITLTQNDLTSSNSLGLRAGEKITVADLLQALLISSSNEAAQALANHSPLGHENFIDQMNQLAQTLHLADTTFVTPEGFDEPDQKTSPYDLALLAQAMLKDSYLKTVVALPSTTISTTDGKLHTLNSTNHYLQTPPTIIRRANPDSNQPATTLSPHFYGVKTGTTPLAGEVLISAVEIDGRHLILVVMGSRNRYQDTKAMLEWIINNYYWQPY